MSLTESVRKALEKRGITLKTIFDALEGESEEEGKAYMERVLKEAGDLQKPAVQEALALVTSRSTLTFMDYKPLEILIKKFKLKEVEEELEQYKRELLQFTRENTPDTVPQSRKRSREESEPPASKLKKKRKHCTMM